MKLLILVALAIFLAMATGFWVNNPGFRPHFAASDAVGLLLIACSIRWLCRKAREQE